MFCRQVSVSILFTSVSRVFSSNAGALLAQEKKLLRVVFVSLSWNSEIPVRVALARGYF